jgi:hypothetical protein
MEGRASYSLMTSRGLATCESLRRRGIYQSINQ